MTTMCNCFEGSGKTHSAACKKYGTKSVVFESTPRASDSFFEQAWRKNDPSQNNIYRPLLDPGKDGGLAAINNAGTSSPVNPLCGRSGCKFTAYHDHCPATDGSKPVDGVVIHDPNPLCGRTDCNRGMHHVHEVIGRHYSVAAGGAGSGGLLLNGAPPPWAAGGNGSYGEQSPWLKVLAERGAEIERLKGELEETRKREEAARTAACDSVGESIRLRDALDSAKRDLEVVHERWQRSARELGNFVNGPPGERRIVARRGATKVAPLPCPVVYGPDVGPVVSQEKHLVAVRLCIELAIESRRDMDGQYIRCKVCREESRGDDPLKHKDDCKVADVCRT